MQVANVAITTVVAALVVAALFGPGAALVVALAGVVAGLYVRQRPPTPRVTRTREVVIAVANAVVLLAANGLLAIAFGLLACGGDGGTSYSAPGSDRDAYCDYLAGHSSLELLLILGPPLLVLGFGLHAARRRDSRGLLGTMLAGVALTLVVHVPPWFLSA